MRIKTTIALLCVAFPLLFAQTQAQTIPIPATPSPAKCDYFLVSIYAPDTPHHGPSHWRWMLKQQGRPSQGITVKSLASPPLRAYIRRIPAGKSIALAWQFRKAELTRQTGLAGLQQLCASRKIGLRIENWASSYAEK